MRRIFIVIWSATLIALLTASAVLAYDDSTLLGRILNQFLGGIGFYVPDIPEGAVCQATASNSPCSGFICNADYCKIKIVAIGEECTCDKTYSAIPAYERGEEIPPSSTWCGTGWRCIGKYYGSTPVTTTTTPIPNCCSYNSYSSCDLAQNNNCFNGYRCKSVTGLECTQKYCWVYDSTCISESTTTTLAHVTCECEGSTLQVGQNCVVQEGNNWVKYVCQTDGTLLKTEIIPITTTIIGTGDKGWACNGNGCMVQCDYMVNKSAQSSATFYCEWVDYSKSDITNVIYNPLQWASNKMFNSVEDAKNYYCGILAQWSRRENCNYEGKVCYDIELGTGLGSMDCCPGLICQRVEGKLAGQCWASEKCLVSGGSDKVTKPENVGGEVPGTGSGKITEGKTCSVDEDCVSGLECCWVFSQGKLCAEPSECNKDLLDMLGIGALKQLGAKYCVAGFCLAIWMWIIIGLVALLIIFKLLG